MVVIKNETSKKFILPLRLNDSLEKKFQFLVNEDAPIEKINAFLEGKKNIPAKYSINAFLLCSKFTSKPPALVIK